MRLLVFFIILTIGSMASAGEFRPVTDIPIPETGVSDPMAEKVEFSTPITPDDGESGGFVSALAGLLHSFPCPVVIWAAPDVQLKDVVVVPDDKEDFMKEYARFQWQIEKKEREIQASGLIGTPTGDRMKEAILDELVAQSKKLSKMIADSQLGDASQVFSSSSETVDNAGPVTKTWTDVFSSIKRVSSDYTIIPHKGFVEIAWGSKESIESLKRNMSREVPPITFIASNPNQILPMWHEVSGFDYDCEESLLKRNEPQVDAQTDEFPESVADDCVSEDDRDQYDEVFTVTHTVPINTFLDKLALNLGGLAWQENEKWCIGEFRDNQALTRVVSDNLRILKKQQDRSSLDVVKRLGRMGLPVLPILLKEFETAQDDYFCSLADVLSKIDCPERDTAFLDTLRSWTPDAHKDFEGISTMIHTLAQRNVEDSLIYANMFGTGIQCVARNPKIDMMKFYHPGPPEDPASVLIAGGNVVDSFTDPEISEVIRILYETISQRGSGTKPVMLEDIERDEKGVTTFRGPLSGQGASWSLRVGTPVKGKAAVFMVEYYGPLNATAYEGIAEQRDGRWLLARWWMKWIS